MLGSEFGLGGGFFVALVFGLKFVDFFEESAVMRRQFLADETVFGETEYGFLGKALQGILPSFGLDEVLEQ